MGKIGAWRETERAGTAPNGESANGGAHEPFEATGRRQPSSQSRAASAPPRSGPTVPSSNKEAPDDGQGRREDEDLLRLRHA